MENDNIDARACKHGKKRTAAQRAADLMFIESHVLRGRTQIQIVDLLANERPYRISRQQVAYDVDELKRRWIEASTSAFAEARAKALRTLDELDRVAWGLVDAPDGTAGEAIRGVLAVHDRRMKLLGLESPARHELSGPGAGPIAVEVAEVRALTETAKAELFKRHMARIAEDETVQPASTVDASN
jgi:hypothetical protein